MTGLAPPGRTGPIGWLIRASAGNPLFTLLLVAALAVLGWRAIRSSPLDAIPDLSDTQVIVLTEWPGRSPDLIEDQVTYPITTALVAAPGVQAVRGQSMFGVSFVYVIFDDGTDVYWARSRVLEYLDAARRRLPDDVVPTLAPDATGAGWVFEYALVDRTGTHDLAELRSIQDWNLRFVLEGVPGVAEVASVGGLVRQYQVAVDPIKLRAKGVTLDQVVRAVRRSNQDVGGQVLEIAGHEHVVRGRGYITDRRDLEVVPLAVGANGAPITVADVGTVTIGADMRRGLAELDGEGEVAGGIVIVRQGQNALEVIDAVKARLARASRTLPDGVEVVITYDRSELIRAAIDTLRTTLIEEMVVVAVVIFLFLLHARSALVAVLTLPVGVVLAFLPMAFQGLTANIMSLGGIAVAIGAMVDASIILIENIHERVDEWERRGRPGPRRAVIVAAMEEVGPSLFFSLLVITVSFLPVFTLTGVEGRLFKPLAFTKTYSMGFAAVLAVTLTPALAVLLIRGKLRAGAANPLNRWLTAAYTPVVRAVVRHRWTVVIVALLAMLITVPAYRRLHSEFMPPLDEGVILYMPSAPPGMSIAEASDVLTRMDREIKAFPEVERVFGKMGRAETATDPAPIGMVETTILLKPRSQWRKGLTWSGLIAELDEKLQYAGMPNIWWMPIQTRTEMLSTGIRSPIAVAVYGDDLADIEKAGVAIEAVLRKLPGTRSASADRVTGGFFIDVVVDREAAARHGLTVADVNDTVTAAIGGINVSESVEGRARYPINVRYARELRDDPSMLGQIVVATPTGAQVPLDQVASVREVTGPPMIRSEDGRLVGYVFVDTDRPAGDYVAEARAAVERTVELPDGIDIEWVGQFRHLERAQARLWLVVPITLLIVFMLLFLNTRSLVETSMVLLAVPFSLIGAVWLLYLLDYNLSVAVWVGLIALAGLDAETGVVMLLYLTLSHRRWHGEGRLTSRADLEDAIVDGAARRVRPKLMTVITTMIGLLPILWSTGTGADVMKRIAAPMVGGLTTSFLLELTVYPALFAIWRGRGLPGPDRPAPPDRAEGAGS